MTSIDPTFLAGLSLAMFGVAAGINQVMAIVDRVKGRPPAEQLKASADALLERVGGVEADLEKFKEKESSYRREIYERIEGMRVELKEVSVRIAIVQTTADNTHNSLVLLTQELRRSNK